MTYFTSSESKLRNLDQPSQVNNYNIAGALNILSESLGESM